MTIDKNILSILENSIPYPTFVLDEDGIVLDFNQKGKKFIPDVTFNNSIFEFLEKDLSELAERLFLETKNFDRVSKDSLITKVDNKKVDFEISVSPFFDDNQKSFLITFRKVIEGKGSRDLKKFNVITEEVEGEIKDEKVLEIIKSVRSSYPFTFIGKAKIQKMIDKLDGFFWIKDNERRFLLVNKKFASALGVNSRQIEGRFERDVIPLYQNKLLNNIDNYIIETTNAVSIEGILSFSPYGSKSYEIIQFPIVDLDNNVVAIIGLSQKTFGNAEPKGSRPKLFNILLNEIEVPFVICNDKLIINHLSKPVLSLFQVEEEIVDKPLSTLIDDEKFLRETESFVESENSILKSSVEAGDKLLHFSMKKIDFQNDGNRGIYIGFDDLSNKLDSKISGKLKMYDILMKTTPQPMFIYDVENLKFLEVNDAALRLYGYKRDEFLNMDLTDLYAPEDIQTLIESSNNKAESNKFTGPWRQKKKDGSAVVVELSKTAIDFKGKKAHFNIIKDISEKVNNDKKIQLFKAAFDNTSNLIFITDKDGFITFANDSSIKSLGYSKQDLDKKPFISFLKDEDRAVFNNQVLHSGSKEVKRISTEFKKSGGQMVKAKISATPISDYTGDIDSFNIIVDLLNTENVETKTEYIEVVKEGTGGIDPAFLSNVFHELLTPVNVIIGFVQELSESIDTPNEEQNEAIEIINENQKLLLQTMDTAAEYSALEDNKIQFRPEELVFVDLIEEIQNTTDRTAKSNKLELTYGKISSSLKLKTDRHHFMILITQFLKYAMQLTKEKKIYLSAFPENGRCLFTIKDKRDKITTGLLDGLKDIFSKSEDDIRRLYGFSRITTKLFRKLMFSLDADRKIVEKDGIPVEYGISLPEELEVKEVTIEDDFEARASKQKRPEQEKPSETVEEKIPEEDVVEINKPEEPVKNGEEKDNREVNINVNVKNPEPAVEEKREIRPPAPARKPVPEEKPVENKEINLSNYKCLYVEDQVDSQILFKVQMKDLQDIQFATSFEEALPKIKSNEFDFIVMDINLEGEYNGLDALRVIQKLPGYQTVPVIAVTAYVLPGDRDKFIAAGFSDFISKPILKDKLMDVLQRIF